MKQEGWQPVRLLEVTAVPTKETEADDPFELVGMGYPSDPETDRFNARCFVEEYAMIGFGSAEIRGLFLSPRYGAMHGMFQRYGLDFVNESIAAVFPAQESR